MDSENTIGFRLAAARIVSGITVRIEAAEALGVSQFALMRYEAGTTNPDLPLLDSAAELYQVSVEFLANGEVFSDRDQMSSRISLVLASCKDSDEVDQAMADRLKLARVESGFTTAAAAARKLDFAKATYLAHESGGRRLPVEKAVHYALQLKVRPEYILLGDGAIRVAPNDPISQWTPLQRRTAIVAPKDWHWLGQRGERGQLNLPVIGEDGRVFAPITKDTLSIPELVLPQALRSLRQPVYAVQASPGEIWVLDPANTIGDVATVGSSGLSITKSTRQQSLPDVLTLPPGTVQGTMLGLIVGRISIQSAA